MMRRLFIDVSVFGKACIMEVEFSASDRDGEVGDYLALIVCRMNATRAFLAVRCFTSHFWIPC